ncbi:MAG TPA: zinc-binding dehydrogenase [Streptosporangiaceae bacterium]|nr:zinc-binding dehydrogenase [Streptosporangiaceae bacterium]
MPASDTLAALAGSSWVQADHATPRSVMNIPATMRALRQPSLNGPQDLHLITDAPVPRPGPDEILIRVTAAGVNFGDVAQAHGTFLGGPRPPYVAGFEAAGEIVTLGDAVTGLALGARVIGVGMSGGAFAEYMVLPAAAAVPVPARWTAEQALGLVVNWPTALAALRPLGHIAAGQTVLIHAAAGGTGQAAVTMAKHYGATVIATASPAKHETARALGADHVLDSRDTDLAAQVLRLTGGTGADLVLESGGGATFGASLAAAKRVTGRVVVYGSAGGEAPVTNWELVYKYQVTIIGLNIGVLIQAAPRIFGEVMGELFALIAAGVLTPGQPTTYDLADGPKALAELAARTTVGKLALLP